MEEPLANARLKEDLIDTLTGIKQWCDAYPPEIFREPDFAKARVALDAAGVSMDGMHGTWARYLLAGIGEIATRALLQANEVSGSHTPYKEG